MSKKVHHHDGNSAEDEEMSVLNMNDAMFRRLNPFQKKHVYILYALMVINVMILLASIVLIGRSSGYSSNSMPVNTATTSVITQESHSESRYVPPDFGIQPRIDSVPPLTRKEVLDKMWHSIDPFKDFKYDPEKVNISGWNSDHRYLSESVKEIKPHLIIEVGVWRGKSVITLAETLKKESIPGVVIAIDTWLGSYEHWLDFWDDLVVESGRQHLYETFMNNIVNQNLQDYVIPLPLDSMNAIEVINISGLKADMIHIDGEHTYLAVMKDLEKWWPVLKRGGIMVGDDYSFPAVYKAFNEFFGALNIEVEYDMNKCRIKKPL